ncbi:hypothetical protein BH10PSE1_BH10PSE1_28300 [soil metagenome]
MTEIELLRAQKATLEAQQRDLRAEHLELMLTAGHDRLLVDRLQCLMANMARAGGELARAEITDAISSSRHTLASPPSNDMGMEPGMPGFENGARYMRHQIAALEEVQRRIEVERQ